jgi:valyl-tRNA synthetase
MRIALSAMLRLFAPFLPFVTEEVWSWWQEGSVHRAAWPTIESVAVDADPLVYAVSADVLSLVRREKSEQKRSLASPAQRVVVHDRADRLAALARSESDVRMAGRIEELATEEGEPFAVNVELAPPDESAA